VNLSPPLRGPQRSKDTRTGGCAALHQRTACMRRALECRRWCRPSPRPKASQSRRTARSRRTVPLPDDIVDALKLHKERQDRARADASQFWGECGLVFTTAVGTPVSPRIDHSALGRSSSVPSLGGLYVVGSVLRRVRLHDLRHAAASLMLAQDVSPHVIMEVLGHAQSAPQ
jgi:integrase